MSTNANIESQGSTQELKNIALNKLKEAELALHAWVCSEAVSDEPTYPSALYDLIRKAPTEARKHL